MRTISYLMLPIFLFILCENVNGQSDNDNDSKYSVPISTPPETNYLTIWYRLDGNRSVYIYFGNNKADLVIVPNINLDKLNNKKLGISQNGIVAAYIVDLLNRYDNEGFELISTETTIATPSWTQCFLKRRK